MVNSILLFTLVMFFIYIYQRIVLPVIVEHLQYKLFSLRDQLRWLKIEGENIDDELFNFVQNSINISTKFVRIFDFGKIVRIAMDMPEINKDEITRHLDLISQCSEEVLVIIKKMKRITSKSIIFNSLIFILWSALIVAPMIYVFIFYKKIIQWLKDVIDGLLTVPESVFDRAVYPFKKATQTNDLPVTY